MDRLEESLKKINNIQSKILYRGHLQIRGGQEYICQEGHFAQGCAQIKNPLIREKRVPWGGYPEPKGC